MIIKAIDFFCGAGGLSRGLLDANIRVLAGVDNNARLKQTYEHNNKPSVFRCADIRTLNIHALRSELGIDAEDLVLYAACTPCQPFSTLNKLKRQDDRKNLLLDFANLVKQAPPDFILVENVPGLNTAYGKEVYAQFLQILIECDFINIESDLLDARDYSVPQMRKRFILVASRQGNIQLPAKDTGSLKTVEDAIGKYPPLVNGQNDATEYHNHVARKMPPHHKRIVEAVPLDGGSRRDIADTSILLPCHQKNPNAHKDVFGRMAWEEPAPTLTGRCVDVYCGRFIHPEQHRGISLREAAALQTFRDDYCFFGSFQFIAQQIGNAVPVLLAKRLGEAITDAARSML